MAQEHPLGRTLLGVWEAYRKAAKHAGDLKRRLNRARLVALGLVIAGAVLGVLADQSAGLALGEATSWLPRALAAASAVALGLAAWLGREILDGSVERRWVFARSQAEALKSETFKYLVKAPPYEGPDADDRLAVQARTLIEEKLPPVPVDLDEADRRRGLPAHWLLVDDYIRERVEEQITGFYEPRAREAYRALRRLRAAGLVLGAIGVVLGGIGASLDDAADGTGGWVAVVGTISGALAAFAFAGRYHYLVTTYELTARRLRWLLADWDRVPDGDKPAKAGAFVLECETAISIENGNWVAEWSSRKAPEPEPGAALVGA